MLANLRPRPYTGGMASNDHPALDLFRRLLSVPSPSGREERLAALVVKRLEELDVSHETDRCGNITVRLRGGDPSLGTVLFAAHMDEIAMVATGIEPDGRIRVDRSGGLYPCKIGEGPVEIVGDGEIVPGILCMGSMHRPDAGSRSVTWPDAWIETGMDAGALAMRGVRVGATAVPARDRCGPVLLGGGEDPLVAAWTFDDRMGVVALLRLIEAVAARGIEPRHPTLVCFTTHEEVGAHGARVLAARERPEVFIAIDGCPIPPGSDLALDGRPGIWSKDRTVHFDQALVRDMCRIAEEAGTELQVAVYESAFSDASAALEIGAAQRAATLGQVRENSHGYEVARLSVFDNLLAVLVRFLEVWS